MAYRLELSDLPPRYRAQAEAQLAPAREKAGRHHDGGGPCRCHVRAEI